MRNTHPYIAHIASSLILSTALIGGCAVGGDKPMAMGHPAEVKAMDGVLAGTNGMTLYTFVKDVANSGKSVCNGPCATNWPPLMAQSAPSAEGYSVVTRDDGQKQIAYKGKPLYFWIKDKQPGDKTGDGFNGVWHAAKQ
jgi:predicted lipoprotein with Yx(FWY)xxD motif